MTAGFFALAGPLAGGFLLAVAVGCGLHAGLRLGAYLFGPITTFHFYGGDDNA